MSDEKFMALALAQARHAASRGEVPVGAVVVRHGEVIATGCNAMIGMHDPTAHAEIVALRAAAISLGNYRLDECEMFVTLEPCAMCSGAVLNARLKRVVYGASEPKSGAAGSVLNLFSETRLNRHTYAQGGVLANESRAQLQEFFRERRSAKRNESLQQHLLREDALRTPYAYFHGLLDYPWKPRYVSSLASLAGLRMHYLDEQRDNAEEGHKALTYLFLHSASGWSYEFRRFLPSLLQAGHRVIAPDLIGFGKSDKPKKEIFHTFTRHRQILIELVEHLDLKNIVLVVSERRELLSLTLPMAASKRYGHLAILENEVNEPNLPLAAGYSLWVNMQIQAPLVDVGRSTARRGDTDVMGDDKEGFDAPFPDQGHRAGLRAIGRILLNREDASHIAIADEVGKFWRQLAKDSN